MSDGSNVRPEVPEGKARFFVTRQKEADDKGFVGYDTVWEPFHNVEDYETPKKPWIIAIGCLVLNRNDTYRTYKFGAAMDVETSVNVVI